MELKHYRIIAKTLIEQDNPISIEKIALLTNLPIDEIEKVLIEFGKLDFLKNKENFKNVQLSNKARGRKS
jgi:predicted transcriptional regulator